MLSPRSPRRTIASPGTTNRGFRRRPILRRRFGSRLGEERHALEKRGAREAEVETRAPLCGAPAPGQLALRDR